MGAPVIRSGLVDFRGFLRDVFPRTSQEKERFIDAANAAAGGPVFVPYEDGGQTGVAYLSEHHKIPFLQLPGEDLPASIRIDAKGAELLVAAVPENSSSKRRAIYVRRTMAASGRNHYALRWIEPGAISIHQDIQRSFLEEGSRRYFFGNVNPFAQVLNGPLAEALILGDSLESRCGWSYMAAGISKQPILHRSSLISAITSQGPRDYQQDGFYLARYHSPTNQNVTILAVADGLGGSERGDLASLAALAGIHVMVAESRRTHAIPYPHDLVWGARTALNAQIAFASIASGRLFQKMPDVSLSLVMVVDGRVAAATVGDCPVLMGRKNGGGGSRVRGCSILDFHPEQKHQLTRTLRSGLFHYYQCQLQPQDWVVLGSDGGLEGLLPELKNGPAYAQQTYHNLNHVLELAPAELAALALHEAGRGNPEIYGLRSENAVKDYYPDLRGVDPSRDNRTVAAYFEGSTRRPAAPLWRLPHFYEPFLEVQTGGDREEDLPSLQTIS